MDVSCSSAVTRYAFSTQVECPSAVWLRRYLLIDAFWEAAFRNHWEKLGCTYSSTSGFLHRANGPCVTFDFALSSLSVASMKHLIRAKFCAGAVMITYGVIGGKVGHFCWPVDVRSYLCAL